jgi:hypothetical protein
MIVSESLCIESSSGPSPEADKIQKILELAAVALVEWHWPRIEAVANSLLDRGELTEQEVASLCAEEQAKRAAKEQPC